MEKILNLYPEDFEKSYTWEDICGILCVPLSADSITISVQGVTYEFSREDDLNQNNQ